MNVRYKDAHEQEVLKTSGFGSDSLVLDGFNEARKGVKARVTFTDPKGMESTFMEITFDTEDSAPYAFFEKAEIVPSWGGFQMIYEAPGKVDGMVHIYYLGINPMTKQMDTLFLKSSPIMKGGDTLSFELKQESAENTVIVRTQDYCGYRVKQKVWEHVVSYVADKMDPKDFEFQDVCNLSITNEAEATGVEYLFDGDTKGTRRKISTKNFENFTFLAGPHAVGAPFIVDMKEGKIPAKLRMYGIIWTGEFFSNDAWGEGELGGIWKTACMNKLPCVVSVYGSNDGDPDASSWVKLGKFEQDPYADIEDRWCSRCERNYNIWYETLEELEEVDPAYLEVVIPASEKRYRYLKIVVEDVFNSTDPDMEGDNRDEYVTMHELEIYVKKEL
ncbi:MULTISPECIES: hypothetical protein [Butyricimonas]|uniref:hypothetical protein n=1 Tax=Butyricimonas TaxID=574697 RepID=UPI0007FB2F86|nr:MULTISPECIES: hypothetical protein [Butyricimonas]